MHNQTHLSHGHNCSDLLDATPFVLLYTVWHVAMYPLAHVPLPSTESGISPFCFLSTTSVPLLSLPSELWLSLSFSSKGRILLLLKSSNKCHQLNYFVLWGFVALVSFIWPFCCLIWWFFFMPFYLYFLQVNYKLWFRLF